MASYVERSLTPGELVRYSAIVSLWRYWLSFLVGSLIVVAATASLFAELLAKNRSGGSASLATIFLVIGIGLAVWPFIARRSTELVITNKRLIAKFGIVSTHSIEIRFDKIESVRVSQGLVGKMLNYGDILVTGTGSTFDPIPNIAHPMTFRSALNQAMEAGQG